MIRRSVLALVVALAAPGVSRAAYTPDDCLSVSSTPQDTVAACTALLKTETDANLRALYLAERGAGYLGLNQPVRSLQDSMQALELSSNVAIGVHYSIGIAYGFLGYFSLAKPEIETGINGGVNDPYAYRARAMASAGLGDDEDALIDLNKVIQSRPDDSEAYVMRGSLNLEAGNATLAMADFDRAIALQPDDAEIYYDRGRAHLILDQYQDALNDFDRARKSGFSRDASELVEEARAALQPSPLSPDVDPGNHKALPVGTTHSCSFFYPEFSRRLGEQGSSMVRYDVLADGTITNVGIDKSSGSARLDRAAVVCVSLHWRSLPAMRDGVAIATPGHQAIIQFRFHDSDSVRFLSSRAMMQAALGHYGEAVALYDTVIARVKDDPIVYFRRGFAEYLDGRLEDASRDFDQAIRLKSDYDDAIAARELVRWVALKARSHPTKGI